MTTVVSTRQSFIRKIKTARSSGYYRLKNTDLESIGRFVDQLKYFQIGSSWGGFESLVAAHIPPLNRVGEKRESDVCLLRFHIGLEDPDDLIDDLAQAREHVPAG